MNGTIGRYFGVCGRFFDVSCGQFVLVKRLGEHIGSVILRNSLLTIFHLENYASIKYKYQLC